MNLALVDPAGGITVEARLYDPDLERTTPLQRVEVRPPDSIMLIGLLAAHASELAAGDPVTAVVPAWRWAAWLAEADVPAPLAALGGQAAQWAIAGADQVLLYASAPPIPLAACRPPWTSSGS